MLSVRDDRFIESLLADEDRTAEASCLDPKTRAFAVLGGLIALDASPASYQRCVSDALAAGATVEEVVGVLVALLPSTGAARVTSAAPKLGLAVGYDVERGLEAP
jgi:alkylhydroperoxidase/carboxymuconolactone decarboxylase family protein YurZ